MTEKSSRLNLVARAVKSSFTSSQLKTDEREDGATADSAGFRNQGSLLLSTLLHVDTDFHGVSQ